MMIHVQYQHQQPREERQVAKASPGISVNRFNAPSSRFCRNSGHRLNLATAAVSHCIENETEKFRSPRWCSSLVPSRSVATRPISCSSSVEGASVLMIRIGDPVIYLPPPLPPLIRVPCTESLSLGTEPPLSRYFWNSSFHDARKCISLKIGGNASTWNTFAIFRSYFIIECNDLWFFL